MFIGMDLWRLSEGMMMPFLATFCAMCSMFTSLLLGFLGNVSNSAEGDDRYRFLLFVKVCIGFVSMKDMLLIPNNTYTICKHTPRAPSTF